MQIQIYDDELEKVIYELKKNLNEMNYFEKIKDKKINYDKVFNTVKEKVKDMIIDNSIDSSITFQTIDMDETIYEVILRDTAKRKKNWYFSEINNKKSLFNTKIHDAREMFVKEIDTIIRGCNNIDDYINLLKQDLLTWKNNKKQDLIKFPYIENKRVSAIENALVDDITVNLLEMIIDRLKKSKPKTKYEEQINSLVSVATDPTNSVGLENKKGDLYSYIQELGENTFIYEIKLDDIKNTSIAEQSSKVINQILKVLNDKDITIFRHLIKHKSETFFMNGIIKFYLDEFCKEIYGYSSTARKDEIIASLTKMSVIKSKGYTDNNSSLITSLISDIKIEPIKSKKTEVTVLIGLTYREEIINGNVTKVYSYLLDEVANNAIARKLLFFLQKERIIIHYLKEESISKYTMRRVPYTYFAQAIIFTVKNKNKMLSKIEDSLKLIAKSKAIILDFARSGDYFDLYYNPLSEKELKDLEIQIETSMQPTNNGESCVKNEEINAIDVITD